MSSHTPECRGHHEDPDPQETRDWLDSLEDVLRREGPARAADLLFTLQGEAQRLGVKIPFTANTPYINTIPANEQPPYPGNRDLEQLERHARESRAGLWSQKRPMAPWDYRRRHQRD